MPEKLGNFGFPVVFGLDESAANTLTFEQVQSGLSVNDRVGWVIQRVETELGETVLAQFNSTSDVLVWGLSNQGSFTSYSLDNPSIKYARKLQRTDLGTAASGAFEPLWFVDDYSTLAGGGILVLPQPMYGFIKGGGLAGAAALKMKVWVKAVDLTDSDYFNLVQNAQLILSN